VPSLHKSFYGKVARFTDRVTTATRTMEAEVDVPNPALEVIPGMYAEVNLELANRRGVLSIPVSAVDMTGTEPFVFTVAGDMIEHINVRTGRVTANRIEILHGLSEGDLVIVGPRASLKPGDKGKPEIVKLPSSPKTDS
jgi:multidrug efflux pump subunit AcrA (membrane-fusion protein)